jgi:aldehyde:ferredoxin oxidoreductase
MESGYINFGDKEGAVKLLKEVKKGSPIGRIVAGGCVLAGKAFGVKRIPQVKGQGMTAYDPRAIKGIGTTFATSPMGADHTAGYTVSDEIFKIGKDIEPLESKGKLALSREFQQSAAFLDSTGLCFFVTLATHGDKRGLKPAVEMINYKYGLKLREEDIYKIGNKILDIEKEFNEKCGISKFANDVPDFMRKEKLDTHGSVYDVDKEELAEF